MVRTIFFLSSDFGKNPPSKMTGLSRAFWDTHTSQASDENPRGMNVHVNDATLL